VGLWWGCGYLTNEKCRSSWMYSRSFASAISCVEAGRIFERETFGSTVMVSFAGVAGLRFDIAR
jgi:hypothetical protein